MQPDIGFGEGIGQDFWLEPVIDRLLSGGICMALVFEWAKGYVNGGDPQNLLGSLFDQEGPGWQHMLSFQRAYDYTWFDVGRHQTYADFHQTIGKASASFIPQAGRRVGMTVKPVLDTPSALMCRQRLQAMTAGEVLMLLIDGDGDGATGEAHGVWGHVVGLSWCYGQSGMRPRFFDPNTGFYTIDDPGQIGAEVMAKLTQFYTATHGLNIKGYSLFEFGR
ncbi:hypothetical protein KPL78_17000 [Roseomonas sp. HJA6]|uniref:Peptidase C58 YopT-type domain-containing protein n=1 Tax=Roseomonas alba TaxID=2846776 RepID=A0ABS7AEG5_9PROT|nr:hypothetical protein [Neoroseomonas alba]MBW6399559.1 hypothetical protein [Neoroseomonas alba]